MLLESLYTLLWHARSTMRYIYKINWNRHRDAHPGMMTWHCDVIMTLSNISGTNGTNYIVFVLNPKFLCFRGHGFKQKWSQHRDVYRDVMTWHRDVFMTLFNILGTNCTIYIVFVLNPMFQKPRIKKWSRHRDAYPDVMTWHRDVIMTAVW